MESPEEVITAIRTAFAGVFPGAITIHEAEVIDTYGSDEERAIARRLDTETSWELVSDADIEACTVALCFLDPEGWRYYIPAYMCWSLRNYRTSDSIVSDFTIYTFDPMDGGDARVQEMKEARYRLLNTEQSRAVCRFLRYMAANDDRADGQAAEAALTQYWGQFMR